MTRKPKQTPVQRAERRVIRAAMKWAFTCTDENNSGLLDALSVKCIDLQDGLLDARRAQRKGRR